MIRRLWQRVFGSKRAPARPPMMYYMVGRPPNPREGDIWIAPPWNDVRVYEAGVWHERNWSGVSEYGRYQ